MDRQLTIILADDEPYICKMLEKVIDFERLGLCLLCSVHDGETLEKEIRENGPDIVLTDISMPRQDGLEVVRKARESGSRCRFIIVSGYRQFEYAYNALKYDVDDYLLKPIEGRELNQVLEKVCGDLRNKDSASRNAERARLHAELIGHGLQRELKRYSLSMEELNRQYQTNFQSGLYRMVFLKLELLQHQLPCLDEAGSAVHKLHLVAQRILAEFCHEIVAVEQKSGVLMLLNYPTEREGELKKVNHTLFSEARMAVDFTLTLCVGQSVRDLYELEGAKVSCERACWARLRYGVNQEIYAQDIPDLCDGNLGGVLRDVETNLYKAFANGDAESLRREYHRIFALPTQAIFSTECMKFVSKSAQGICREFGDIIHDSVRGEKEWEMLRTALEVQKDFASYEKTLTDALEQCMGEILAQLHERKAKPVLRACAYVEQHYAEQLTLEAMAGVVNLNPIYFSGLFKKETGRNFSEYLTEFRMQKAKEFLRKGEKNINEIADALGYTDARYFSKVFKKTVGVKPTDYRKIYG